MIRKLIDAVAFRTTKQYTKIKIRSLDPNYWDKDTLLLHAVMQLVVDFVEVECAFMELDAPYTWRQWLHLKLPWFLRSDEVFRNRELGLKHLEMLASFYDDKVYSPSDAPKELVKVYLWWKDVRPKRVEPDVASGFGEYVKNNSGASCKTKEFDKLMKKANKIEQQYEKEDTEMLIKAIKNRGFMWT